MKKEKKMKRGNTRVTDEEKKIKDKERNIQGKEIG
jgi:hypothetical protein